MHAPRMIVVAGPPGNRIRASRPRCGSKSANKWSGSSPIIFTTEEASLMKPQCGRISPSVRRKKRESNGFLTVPLYVALDDVKLNISRVAVRADAGGHSAPPDEIRRIHSASVKNLAGRSRNSTKCRSSITANRNSGPDLVLEGTDGRISYVTDGAPRWLRDSPVCRRLRAARLGVAMWSTRRQ